jgi:hypothetical protein
MSFAWIPPERHKSIYYLADYDFQLTGRSTRNQPPGRFNVPHAEMKTVQRVSEKQCVLAMTGDADERTLKPIDHCHGMSGVHLFAPDISCVGLY